MTDFWDDASDSDETVYAQGRQPDRTYASKTFPIDVPSSRDYGESARFIYKVFDNDEEQQVVREGEVYIVEATERAQRYQLKVLVAREAGSVKDLWIQKVPPSGNEERAKQVLNLRREDAHRLIELLRNLNAISVDADVPAVRVDDDLLRAVFSDPNALARAYREDPAGFRRVIADDETARDIVAVAHRRSQLERFRRLLEEEAFFDSQVPAGSGPEAVWQAFLEENPWLLGVSLGTQLLSAFRAERLEQVVAGATVADVGKRADALLRTAGRVRSMVFAEIKHHRSPLLHREYRPGCWAPSGELAGGVAQVQGTVQRAMTTMGLRLPEQLADGSESPGEFTYLIRPKSYLIIGHLGELVGDGGGHHKDKIQSFELFRRHTQEPEIITFDELFARAVWLVELAEETGTS